MNTITFDTLKLAERLQAGGFTPEQSRTAASAIAESMAETTGHATKEDIVRLEGKIDTASAETRVDILKWVLGAMAAQTAFLSAIRFFGH